MKNFGFGCMRLPMKDGKADRSAFSAMVDCFLAQGFTYFDTAHGYLGGESETAIRDCLVKRYPREAYTLTNKLSTNFFISEAEIRPLFKAQLAACGVEWFDWYLMHSQTAALFEKYTRAHAYETALALMAEGKFRHFGISFHDKPEVLERILNAYPQIEAVQLQFNYADYDDPVVEARRCYEVCVKYGKRVIVMEPVKGGLLATLPAPAHGIFDALGGTPAGYAIRFAASRPAVMMVLSGMSTLAQVQENTALMKDFKPLSEAELATVFKVRDLLRAQQVVPCTSCRYCIDGCPQHLHIPDLFSCLNTKRTYKTWNADYYYHHVITAKGGKASECIKCGKCEQICPQHLKIRELLEVVAEEFDRK